MPGYAAAVQRRIDAVEHLDGPLDDPATLAGNLRDLRRVNRWLGGAGSSVRAIEALAGDRSSSDALQVLDVGTGGADIPVAWLAGAARSGRRWTVIATDARPVRGF